ncbi:MAG: hypothetical protein ACI32C_01630 [Candidatus Enteromonas sp.]
MVEMFKRIFASKRSAEVKHKTSRRPVQKFMESLAEGYGMNLVDEIHDGNF